MTKWRGSHFRSMGVNGESIVTVKPPWVKYLSLWATQRQLFCKSSVLGDSIATRPEETGWCTRHCIPFMVKYLPVLVLGLHQPLLGFRFLPGGSRAVLRKCLWRSQLWKAPALRRSVWLWCIQPAHRQYLQLLLSRERGAGGGTQGIAIPVSRSCQNHLKIRLRISIGKWSPT